MNGWRIAAALGLAMLSEGVASAQQKSGIEVRPPEHIVVRRPERVLQVNVTADRRSYTEGDEVRLTVRTSEDAWIWVFSTDENGETTQLLPNLYDRNQRIQGGAARALPSGRYRLVAADPGRETVTVLAVAMQGEPGWRPPVFAVPRQDAPFPRCGETIPGLKGRLERSLIEHQRTIAPRGIIEPSERPDRTTRSGRGGNSRVEERRSTRGREIVGNDLKDSAPQRGNVRREERERRAIVVEPTVPDPYARPPRWGEDSVTLVVRAKRFQPNDRPQNDLQE